MVDEQSEEAVVSAVHPATRKIVYGGDTHAYENHLNEAGCILRHARISLQISGSSLVALFA